jgi:hypothetical protein
MATCLAFFPFISNALQSASTEVQVMDIRLEGSPLKVTGKVILNAVH